MALVEVAREWPINLSLLGRLFGSLDRKFRPGALANEEVHELSKLTTNPLANVALEMEFRENSEHPVRCTNESMTEWQSILVEFKVSTLLGQRQLTSVLYTVYTVHYSTKVEINFGFILSQ